VAGNSAVEEILAATGRLILRFLGYVIVQLVLEFAVKGPGYVVVRIFKNKEDVDPGGRGVLACGLLFWLAVTLGIVCVVTSYRGQP
jgi:hypothetical protein